MNANSKALHTKGNAAESTNALTVSKAGVLAQLVAPNNVMSTPETKQLLYGTPTYPVTGGWFVNIGRKYDAFCPNSEFGDAEISTRSLFIVTKVRSLEDVAIISRVKAQPWDELISLQKTQEVFFVKVVKTGGNNEGSNWAVVEFLEGSKCKGLKGFIPPRHLHVRDAAALDGQLLPVTVAKLDPRGSKEGLIHLSYEQRNRENSESALAAFKPGEYVEGTVLRFISTKKSDTHPSVIVQLRKDEHIVEAMIHNTEVTGFPAQKANEVLTVGQTVRVHILRRSANNKSFALSMRSEEKARFLSAVEPGFVLEATVTRKCDYGYFVDLGKSIEAMIRTNQLVHKNGKFETLKVGDVINVLVFKYDKETGKLILNRGHLKPELQGK
ncbi:MAG TPA: S1 RNA-binding domain-containing protein [Oculatellaceae cyanobacterium]